MAKNKAKKATKKTTKKAARRPAELLGLTRIPLTVKSCRERAKELRGRVEKGKLKGELASMARRWASWYASKANQLQKANQRTKARRKAA